MPVSAATLSASRRCLLVGLSLDEIGEILRLCVAFDLGEIGARHRAPWPRAPPPCSAGCTRIAGGSSRKVAKVEQGRNQDQPAYADTLLGLQVNDFRTANAAIALACHEFRRQQPVVFFQPAPDHQRNRTDVAVDRKEPLAHVLAGRDEAAEAGADGIDENEIGEVEPGLGIGQHVRRRGRHRAIAADRQPPRPAAPNCSQAEDARAAVEQKRHRPACAIGAVELVGGIGDIGLRLALVVEQLDRARGMR